MTSPRTGSAKSVTALLFCMVVMTGGSGAGAADVGVSQFDESSPAAKILVDRIAPGVVLKSVPPAAAASAALAAPAAPVVPTFGRGLMVYFRSADTKQALQQTLGPASVLRSMDRTMALAIDGDIPAGSIDDRTARDIAYVGEVPVPTNFDGNVIRNVDAIDTHQVDEARKKHGLSGDKVQVGVWDGGKVLVSHVEFKTQRARQIDSPADLSNHATHVAGTIGANGDATLGGNSKARGMAPKVAMQCHDWNGDTGEMQDASKKGVVCSNHSYGAIRGWYQDPQYGWLWFGYPDAYTGGSGREDGLFGRYEGQAYSFDSVVFENPSLSVFVAAGNDRNDDGPPAGSPHFVRRRPGADWTQSSEVRQGDGAVRGGYDTIAGTSLAKNVITVGAINDITVDPPQPKHVEVTNFSCWGPADDGRIKPDVVANGWQLFSPVATGDDKYDDMNGTSMATPTATGIGALLSELMMKKQGRYLRADEMKAVLVHTAMSPNPGPSAQIGWGSIRADIAADVVAGEGGILMQGTVTAANPSFRWHGRSKGNQALRVTLVWTDPPGEPNTSETLNDSGRGLVHDLDVLVTEDSAPQAPHHPWTLEFERADLAKPAERARNDRANHVDNVERVDVAASDAPAGNWTIAVAAPFVASDQNFALIVSGLEPI